VIEEDIFALEVSMSAEKEPRVNQESQGLLVWGFGIFGFLAMLVFTAPQWIPCVFPS